MVGSFVGMGVGGEGVVGVFVGEGVVGVTGPFWSHGSAEEHCSVEDIFILS